MCFCSLLYAALWLGRDALQLEQLTLWLVHRVYDIRKTYISDITVVLSEMYVLRIMWHQCGNDNPYIDSTTVICRDGDGCSYTIIP